jgi:hypothetical protein
MKISSSLAAALFALLALTTLVQCVAQSPSAPSAPATSLSPAQLDRIGKRIWQNECAGTIDGLTSWNSGEDFASLGIGHFIWYPAGRRGPFEESFPRLIAYLGQRGINAPAWMQGPCLWNDRAAFLADKSSPRQQELRRLLSNTVREQTEFIRLRSRAALPKMLAAAGPNANRVRHHFDILSATPEGTFALIDYVNFKGEGTAPAERYQGRGWGLLQVLETMTPHSPADAPAAFADSASRVLTQRVQLSPPDRGESRWLPGWKNRCQTYKQPL